MAKEITFQLSRKQAEELATIALQYELIKEEEYEDEIKKNMKPMKALFG